MVSEETKTKVIERVKELEEDKNRLESELDEIANENEELLSECADKYHKLEKYKTNYLFQKKLNSNMRKTLVCGGILFAATFFVLGYLVGTKSDDKYQPVQQQNVEIKKEPEQKKNKTEWEEILDKAFEKYQK